MCSAVNKQHGSLGKANDLLKGLSSCMRVGVASGEVKGEAAFHDHEVFDRENKRMKQACAGTAGALRLLLTAKKGPGAKSWRDFLTKGEMAKVYHKRNGSVHWVKRSNVQLVLSTGKFWADQRHIQTESDESLRGLEQKISLNERQLQRYGRLRELEKTISSHELRLQQLRDQREEPRASSDVSSNDDGIPAAQVRGGELKTCDSEHDARVAGVAGPGDETSDDDLSRYDEETIRSKISDMERIIEDLSKAAYYYYYYYTI